MRKKEEIRGRKKMYLITTKTMNDRILTFRVEKYEIKNNHVIFRDPILKLEKSFPSERTSIEEVM